MVRRVPLARDSPPMTWVCHPRPNDRVETSIERSGRLNDPAEGRRVEPFEILHGSTLSPPKDQSIPVTSFDISLHARDISDNWWAYHVSERKQNMISQHHKPEEDVMKAHTMLAAALLIGAATIPAAAQEGKTENPEKRYFSSLESYQHANLNVLRRNFRSCLDSDNDGVVESAIAHIIRMKMYLKAEDFSDLKSAIDWLSVAGRTPAIRYKAYLAILVLDNPNWFKDECCKEYAGTEEMFTTLAKRLQQTLIGYADHKYVRPE
jgi:hypothetical protein